MSLVYPKATPFLRAAALGALIKGRRLCHIILLDIIADREKSRWSTPATFETFARSFERTIADWSATADAREE